MTHDRTTAESGGDRTADSGSVAVDESIPAGESTASGGPSPEITDGARGVPSGTDGAARERTGRGTPEGATASASDPDVAFYVPSLRESGAEKATVNVANGLARRGYAVTLLVSRRGTLASEVRGDVSLIEVSTPRIPGVGIGASVPGLASYLRRAAPDVLFSQMTYANVVCLLARKLAGVETVLVPTEHNTFGVKEAWKERLTYRLAERLYPDADQVVAVSRGAAESIADHTPLDREDVSVLHNPIPVSEIRREAAEGVDHRWFRDDETEVVLNVGRMERQKDLPTFLRAFRIVRERRPEARAILAGTGSRREQLISLADRLGVDDAVSFPGFVDNAYAYMDQASVFALSSRHEGLPTVLLEALACGCPIASTDCPSGPREILADGEYGPLVPVGDEEALAEAIVAQLDDPTPAAKLERRADDFAPGAALDRYEDFIRRHWSPDG